MSPRSPGNNNNDLSQDALAQHTSTAAETSFTTVNAALDGGATGFPLSLEVSGSVSGVVGITFGAQATKYVSVAPNQAPIKLMIPKTAFPNKVNSVPVQFECSGGEGTLIGIVKFNVG